MLICVFVFAYADCWFSHAADLFPFPLFVPIYGKKMKFGGGWGWGGSFQLPLIHIVRIPVKDSRSDPRRSTEKDFESYDSNLDENSIK